MATLAPPDEQVHDLKDVPEVRCGTCQAWTTTQVYVITLKRPRITRKWYFCSLDHLRIWAEPVH